MKTGEIKALITEWSTSGIITPEQANILTERVTERVSEKSGSTFIASIMYIGALGISLGALLLIASNWEELTDAMKVGLALLLPTVPLGVAYWWLVVREKVSMLARAANGFGIILIGGSLALIAQIYHLEPDMVSFLWQWALFSAPFIWAFRKLENVALSTLLVGAAIFYSSFEYLMEARIEDKIAILVITVVCLLYAYGIYRMGTLLRYAGDWISSGRTLRLGGAMIAIVTLFITTFEEYAHAVLDTSYYYSVFFPSLGFNLFFVAFLVFVLLQAAKYEEYGLAMTCVRIFGLYLVVKFLTLFESMLDTGLFLIAGGVFFIIGALILEKNKHYLIDYMKRQHKHHEYE